MDNRLDHIFQPKTIAVIGASNRVNTIGYALMHNLVGSRYKGMVFPVNLKETSIQGVKCYHHIGEIPEDIDLAIVATPAHSVPEVIMECGEAKVGGVLIISSGFKEVGEEGKRISDITLEIARRYNLRILGPNCLGFINPSIGLNASFAGRTAKSGKIAFISQSGALCTSILERAKIQRMGFSHFVSIGDMIDIGFHDLIDYFGRSASTSSILIYMESLADARKFMSAARAFARDKPIIVLKAGRSREGARATLSHTGSLAGNDAVFDAALKRAGVIRVETISQLFNCAQSLAIQPRPKGNRLTIITNAGGPGILATDHLIYYGGRLADLSEKTMEALNRALPESWSHSNPVDLAGDANPVLYRKALEICLKDENTDGVMVILTPQALTQPKEVEKELIKVTESSGKTILAAWMGEGSSWSGKVLMRKGKVPVYQFPEDAVDVFLKMYQYTSNIELLQETPSNIPEEFTPDTHKAHQLLDDAINAGRKQLTELEAKEILTFYGMSVSQSQLATTAEEAVKIARKIGFPVVLKIVSYEIGLKTDLGGVKLNIKNPKEVILAYEEIIQSIQKLKPEVQILGISVEKMVFKRNELLIGANKDPIFGSVIVFGMGGIAVEVFKDMAIELPPLNMALAKRIIEGTKIFNLLKGYRGIPQSDIRAVQFLLYKFAYLVIDCPQILEIDINPFVIDESGGVILDAYIILDKNYERKPSRPYSHMVISPYPKQYESHYRMKNGRRVLLRPIRPEDEPLEEALLSSLSKQSQYFRFFGFMPSIPKKLLKRSAQIDYDREMAIIAIIKEKGKKKMIAEVRLLATHDNTEAEFAIIIADEWQGMGLGNKMTSYILDIARQRNIETINATVLKVNKGMIQIFKNMGFAFNSLDHSTYNARLDLS